MLKPFLLTGVAVLMAGTATQAAAQSQYGYQSGGARYLGPPVFERDPNYQPFTQTPTYYYNNTRGYTEGRPGYGYEGPAYSYAPPAYGYRSYDQGYTYEQNLRERSAFAANQAGYGQPYYTTGYPSDGHAFQTGSTWQDGYGRNCYWVNGSGDDRYPSWVQTCR